MALTRKQRSLIRELEELTELLGLNCYQKIDDYDLAARTTLLEITKRAIARGQVVVLYTLVDELLSMRICRYFFPGKRSFPQLWKTKRFRLFNHHVIEGLSLLQKLHLAKSIKSIPKSVAADIERLNALRNGLAHAFFPENLKRSRPEWKGVSVFTLGGVKRLLEDYDRIFHALAGVDV